MRKSKFISLLRSLSEKERKEFRRFMEGLYSRQKVAIEILRYIEQYQPKFESDKLEKDQVLEKVFGIKEAKSKDEKNLSNTLSDLYKYLEEYLLWQSMKERSFDRTQAMLKIFQEKRLNKFYFQQIDNQLRTLNKASTPQGLWLNLQRMLLMHQKYYYSIEDKVSLNANSMQLCMDYLDNFFVEAKLRYSAELFSRATIVKEDYKINFLHEVMDWHASNTSQSDVYRQALLNTFNLTQEENHQLYFQQKELLINNYGLFEKKEYPVLFYSLINYAALVIKRGERQFLEEIFSLYKFGLQKELFIENGFITYVAFHNITNLGCKLKEFEWVEQFIKKWSVYLPKDIKEHACKISWALLYFEQKEFEKVIDCIKDLQFLTIAYFSIRSRWLTLCSFYELGYSESLVKDYCKSFEVFLRRNKTLQGKVAKSYFNLIRFIRMFLRKNISKATLEEELAKTEVLACKLWVEEKIEDIEQRKATYR
ncbi:MAG: hypothetical protein AAGG75_11130 [Bacteroidota bacterium]